MTQVIVRNIDEDIKETLKLMASQPASQHGWSMEEEVRQILLRSVCSKTQTRTKLGSRIAARIVGVGLNEPLPELRGKISAPWIWAHDYLGHQHHFCTDTAGTRSSGYFVVR